eukprot:10017972-Alexandrium_andersonii.AAC.1
MERARHGRSERGPRLSLQGSHISSGRPGCSSRRRFSRSTDLPLSRAGRRRAASCPTSAMARARPNG